MHNNKNLLPKQDPFAIEPQEQVTAAPSLPRSREDPFARDPITGDWLTNSAVLAPSSEHAPFAGQQAFELAAETSGRWQKLHTAWNAAKKVVGAVGSRLSIETDGERLSVGETIRARLYNATLIPALKARPGESLFDPANNRVVRKAIESRTNANYSKADYAKAAGYEILTLAPIRAMGMMAIRSAAGLTAVAAREGGKTHGTASAIYLGADRWLARAEAGNDNPVTRKKKQAARRIGAMASRAAH
jgi:hypothetical protein